MTDATLIEFFSRYMMLRAPGETDDEYEKRLALFPGALPDRTSLHGATALAEGFDMILSSKVKKGSLYCLDDIPDVFHE